MKIIKIEFKNINNLKGEQYISFEEVPLSTAGIFAIVGPTGSGKSTILDVITLALFNRIPRFNKSISTNEIIKEGSVITHHTKDAFAAIEYEIKGRKYKSRWSVDTNRNGKLRDYNMTFYNPDGSVEDLKKSEVPAKNEDIIGLKYDQFIKSILLSQGEFSKFLKADKNERGALLENLTGTSIYRKIGQKTYEKYKQVKENLEREKALINVLTILDEDERKKIENDLNNSIKEKPILEKEMNAMIELLQIKIDIKKITSSLSDKQREDNDIKKQISEFKQEQLKLNIHRKLSHVQGSLATYNDAVANTKRSQENLNQYLNELEVAKKKHITTIDEMANLSKQNVNEENFKRIMNSFETEINNADRDLENLKNNGIEIRTTINNRKTNYQIALDDKINPNEAKTLLTERARKLQIIISKSQLDTTKPLPEIIKEHKKSQEELKQLKDIHIQHKKSEELRLRIIAEEKKLHKFIETKTTKTPLIGKCKIIIESTNQQIALLIKQKEDAIKIAKLEEFRSTLVSGEHCPLCGALEHPFTENNPEPQQNEIDQKIEKMILVLKRNQQELIDLNNELSNSNTAIDLTQQSINESSQLLKELEVELEKEIKSINNKLSTGKDKITETIESITNQLQITEEAIGAISEMKENKNLIDQYQQLKKYSDNYTLLKQKRDKKFKGPEINIVTNRLQDSFEKSKSKITEVTTGIKKETESLKRNESVTSSIAKDLQPKITKLGFSDISQISSNLLDEATLNSIISKQDQLNRDTTKIETEIKNLNQELYQKKSLEVNPEKTIEPLKQMIQDKKIIVESLQNIFITNQQKLKRDDQDLIKIKVKKDLISVLSQEFDKWSLLNQIVGDATGNKFANFAQGLTLQNLLAYANRRLSNLSDRYLLDKPENEGSLIVIDSYQGNTSRSVKTLSGGESFLISLALALSLSDMASKNVALDCLFIDEGFGTLDPDTLELAMTTLEKLQSESQKTVGVISHVEALKERIHVQVKLKKNTQGYSKIEVIS